MRWRDIRFEKPTEADADNHGRVLQLLDNGDVGVYHLESKYRTIAWMPMSELPAFDRIPDPPEGWRFVEKEKDKKRLPYKYVKKRSNEWQDGDSPGIPWERDTVYAVPIDPPSPQYRPFANSAEFEPYELKFWRYKDDCKDLRRKPCSYSNDGHFGDGWSRSFDSKVFSDGSPFGVKVET